MEIKLDGRVALITGGSKGLGLATAKRFAQSGADVAIVGRDSETLETAENIIRESARGKVASFPCDVAKLDEIESTYKSIKQTFGTVDILMNNAGVHASAPFEKISEEMWQQDIDLKLMASVRLSRLAFADMKARNWGRIMNVLNIYAKAPRAKTAPTAVTRAATMALTKALAHEGAPFNILVNGLIVGVIESDQYVRAFGKSGGTDYDAFLKAIVDRNQVPMGRMGRAEEFANVACFLASDAASYVTGSTINIDGGLSPVL